MDKPLISCIVPVFNGERFLPEALESIWKQTYFPLEIIVVDDGSTDGTPKIVNRYRDRVRYLKQENAGPSAARNSGIGAARGEFVAFLDVDDLWLPAKLTRQMAQFQSRPEADCCVTNIQNFWAPELREEQEKFRHHRISRAVPGYVAQTLLARRAIFEKVGLFNTALRYGEAAEWFLRAGEHGTVTVLLDEVLVYRRLHQVNETRLQAAAVRDTFLEIVKASLERRRRSGKLAAASQKRPPNTPVD